ncbi:MULTISPECIES: hypothetical protein [Arthrobacter]|uniref:Uncharacterized protein n=1 Tax=Arthrobacter terricola TaxID=2547396 RepID=A0A4R5KMJ3_9MICC|nr:MULTISPECIES: hypothetical protein [Arthrobacter]MBT8160976.1 hypothetical protein [Arthrobacter sp. GN70]TDF96839.1 hypothetical protein E1809_08945 [Arthrobacter terricola]
MTDKPHLTAAHEVDRVLHEQVFYPEHDKRTESPAYAKVHHRLVVTEDRPCLICGVRNSTLNDPAQNPHGAKQIETHHHIIEWALQNAIDLDKFNEHVWPNLQARHPGVFEKPFTQQEMLDFIDHSEFNLWCLCDIHHRHQLVGIHSITAPIWGAQNLIKDEFTYIPGGA